MRPLEQRRPRAHDREHLNFVRQQPCCVCGSTRNVEAAHVRMACASIGKPETGMQEKPSDAWTLSLCRYHHQDGVLAQHRIGEQRFWFEVHGRNPFEICQRLWIESGGAARAQEPKPAPRQRKIKPRKPRDKRQKIAKSNRPIPYRRFDGTPVYAERER